MKTIAPPAFPLPTSSKRSWKASSKTNRPKKPMKEYGAIRVLVIGPKGAYCRTVWCAIGLGFANILIGAVNLIALMYTLASGDVHAVVCTAAFHLFSAQAILSLNHANGWSTPMRQRHRRFTHVLLQVCGMCCAVAGTTLVCVTKGVSGSAHGIVGLITAALALITLLAGVCALLKKKTLKIIHKSLGIPTFVVSSICLILGCLTTAFKDFASMTVVFIIISFIVFYTIFVIGTVFMKCLSRF